MFKSIRIIPAFLAVLFVCSASLAQQAEVTYNDDFQSYGSPRNPAGWVDNSIGKSTPIANGLYKTWPDPLQGNKGTNIVYGTKQSSGKPEGNNPRIGTFSTLTTKSFKSFGRFEYRGRFIRTSADTRIGFTFHSSYPEKDSYYLVGLWTQPATTKLTMQLFGFGAGTITKDTDSEFTPEINKWYRFLVQVDDVAGATNIRARFWLDGTEEPKTFTIDATDASTTRLKEGRIGIWSAVKGDAYVDDLFAKSPVDHTAPVITFFEGGVQLQPGTITPVDHDARVDIRATDDLSGLASLTATADGQPYTPLAPIAAEGPHTIHAIAKDNVGNTSESSVQVLVDKTAPVITLTESGTPLPLPFSKFRRIPAIDIKAADTWTKVEKLTATMDGKSDLVITEQGTHYLVVEAVDTVGNKSVVQATILVDFTAPVISFYESGVKLDSPVDFKFDPSIEVRVTDVHSTVEYTATLDGNPWSSRDPIPSEGRHVIVVSAEDLAGNTASATLELLVDKGAPVVVLKESGNTLDPAETAKFKRDAAIEILVTDAVSKPEWSATLNGAPYTSLTPITAEQTHVLKVHATDEADNVTDVTLSVLVDKSAPVIAFYDGTTKLDPRELQKFQRDVAIDIKVTDAVSTATYTATIGGAPYSTGTLITNENEHAIVVKAVDDAGNTAEATLTILVDKTKPVIAFSESGTPLDTTKQTPFGRDVRVDIAVTDNLPGVTYTAKLDGADYVSGAPITADGPHAVTVEAIDRAENTAAGEVKILVDKTGPVIGFFESNTALDVAKRQDFNKIPSIEIRVTDALSNVTYTATLDNAPYTSGTPVQQGYHTIAVRATDALGNVTDAKIDLLVDTTAPVVVLKEGDNNLPATGAIFARDVLVRPDITDISKTTTVATLDGSSFSLSVPISAEGERTLQVVVTDELNWSTTVGSTFTIDKTAPKISVFEGTTPLLHGASFARDIVINASAEDITAYQLIAKIDGALYTLGSPYTANGSHKIVVEAVDAAGNKSTTPEIVFHIDKNAPEVTLLESGQPFPAGKTFTRDINATVNVVAATETTKVATIDGQPYELGSAYAPEGKHHIKVVVTNLANLSTTVEADFTIDKTPPTIRLFAAPDKEFVADMKFAADLTPSTQADDNLSKPPKVVVLLDNQQLAPGSVVSEEKVHTISATATDDGGLSTTVGPFTFVLDKTPPEVEVLVEGEPLKDGDQFNKEITPEIKADDLTATTFTVTLNDQPYTIGTQIAADAKYTLVVRVKDDLGNETILEPIHFVVDKTAPIVQVLESDEPFAGGKFKRSLMPVVRIQDLTETITSATLNDKPWSSGQEISSEDHYTLKVTVTDELNWVTVVPPIEFTIDKSAPVVTITESGTPLVTDTIFNRDARPKIEATDTTNVAIEATLDGAPFTSETVVATEAKHTLVVKATDELGFVTEVPPIVFTVDKTPPVVAVTEQGVPFIDNALLNHDAVPQVAVVDLTAFTIEAKVDGQPYTLGTPVAGEGSHTFDVKVTDAAAWSTTVPAIHFVVDKSAPVVAVKVADKALESGNEFRETIAPVVVVNDISTTTITATLDGAPWTSGTPIASEGEHVLSVSVTDAANWTTTLPPITFIIDKSAPVVRVLEKGVVFASGTKFNRDVEPKIEIEDLTKTTIAATLDGAAWTPDTLITTESASHVLAITVTDNLGQATTVPPISFTIDKTAPVVTVTEGGQPLVTGSAFNRNVKPEITIADITNTTTTALLNEQPYTFGTELSEEAKYSLTATVVDELEWSTTIPAIVFFIDKTAPVVTLMEGDSELTDGQWFNRDVTPRAIVQDTTETTTTATLNDQPYELGTPVTAEGAYTLKVRVTDKVGLSTDVPPVTFTIDKTPPAIAFTHPIGGSTITTPRVIVTGEADDAVSVEVNGIEATIADKKFATPVAIELLEGENTIVALGIDRAGNNTTTAIPVTLDTRAPELSVTAPAQNACLNVTEIAVSGRASDASLSMVKVTMATTSIDATIAADRRSFTATIPAPAEGKFTIRVEATDASGHTAVAAIAVVVDRTKPVIAVTESGVPFTASAINRPVALDVRATNDPNATLTVTLDGQPYTPGTVIASETPAPHVLRATAKDCAGLVSDEKVVQFVVDRTPPGITSINPGNGATVGEKPSSITGTLSEPAAVVLEATGAAAQVSGVAFTLAAPLQEGLNTFVLVMADAAGNSSRFVYTVTIHTTAPSVEIVENGLPIPANHVYRRAVTPVIRSDDAKATITATLNNAPFTSGTEITSDGNYTITAKARDSFGHESATASVTFKIDRSGPTVDITSPAQDAVINAESVEVRGTTNASSVTVNTIAAAIANGAFTATVPLELGPNTLIAVAVDAAGNGASDAVDVTRDTGKIGILLATPPDKLLTNRPTTLVAGQVLTPTNARSVTINSTQVSLDPAGMFRVNDFALSEGPNTITASVNASSGETNSISVTVTADFTPPVLKVLANSADLGDGARFATSPSITLDATDENPAGLTTKLTIDGELVSPGVTTLLDGGHALTAIARDAAGNETRVDRVFFIGTAGSFGGCALSAFDPIDGAAVFTETVRITGRSGGAIGVQINDSAASVADGSFCGDATLAPGRNEVTIRCTDASGQPTSDPASKLILYRYIDPTIAITSPAAGSTVTATNITVTGTVGAGVVSGDVNGIFFTVPDDGAETHTFSVPNVPIRTGLNVITARAKTKSSRIGVATTRVHALNSTPQIAITSPLAGTDTGATSIDVSGTYTDIDPSTITVKVGTTQHAALSTQHSDTTGTFTATVPLAAAQVSVIEAAGRNGAGAQASSTVDVTHIAGGPSVTIDTPKDNTYFPSTQSTTLRVTGTFTGDAGTTVSVNGVVATITGSTFAADVELSSAAISQLIARATAPDARNASDSVRVVRFADALAVRESFPANDATSIDRGAAIVVLFNHPLDRSTAAGAFRMTDADGTTVDGALFVERDAISFASAQPLRSGVRYTINLSTSLKDVAGSSLAAAHSFAFTTGGSAPANAPIVDDTNTTGCFNGTTLTGRVSIPGAQVQIEVDGVKMRVLSDAGTGAFKATFAFSGQTGYHIVRVAEVGADGSLSAERALCFRINCTVPNVLAASLDRTAKTVAIQFSKPMDLSTLVAASDGTIVLVPEGESALTGTVALNATGDTATITLASVPAKHIALTVKKSVKDTSGASMVADYTQTFQFSDDPALERGKGYVSGAVYDATNGRPLAGAKVFLNPQSSILNSNAKGRYTLALPEGAYTIEASAPGYTTVWRQVVVPAGAGVVPIDIRLTRRGTALTHGGDTKITKPVELTLASAADVRVTAVGGQSLAGLLPLGWSPLASAEVSGTSEAIPGAKLTFHIDASAVTAAAQTLALVQYDSEADEWRVLAPIVNVGSDGSVVVDISETGNYTLVYADKNSTVVARAGAALTGIANPCVTTPDVCRLTGKSFVLDPKAVLPSGRTVATLTTDGTKPYPSGTAVQAFIDEQLNLADGRVLVDPPFATDLLIYRNLAGTDGIADFHLSPTLQAQSVILRDGVDHIRIVDYPGRIDRGALIGSEGGRVPGDGSVTLDIPAGATSEPLHASVASITDLSAFGSIAGFQIAAGFTFSLTRANETQPTEGFESSATTLLTPARATFNVASTAQQIVLAEVLDNTPYGVLYRLAAPTSPTSFPGVYSTRPIVSTELPLDGIIREGRYLVLVANQSIAYAYGTVVFGGGAAASAARVTPSTLGVTDLTRFGGTFVVPVPATTFTLTPRHTSTGDGAPYNASSAPAADAKVNVGALTLTAQPPRLTSVTPANGAEVDVTKPLVIAATFDTTIDPSSVANAITVFNLTTAQALPGSVTAAGSAVGFNPAAPIAAASRYSITVAPAIRSSSGAPFGQTVVTQFSTAAIPPGNTTIRRDLIRITIPDENGRSVISGTAGALPAGAQAVAVRRGRYFIVTYTTTVAADGSFWFNAGDQDQRDRISTDDTIDLQVLDRVSQAIIAVIELTPFASGDGRGFLAPAGRNTIFTSADGIAVTVPEGAFDVPTMIRLVREEKTAFAAVPSFDETLNFSAAVKLDFDGIASKPLEIEIPAPAGFDASRSYYLGRLSISMRGPRVEIVDLVRVDGNKFITGPASGSSSRLIATNAAAFSPRADQVFTNPQDVRQVLLGALRSGIYNVIDLRAQVGWSLIQGVAANVDLFWDTMPSLHVSPFTLAESRGRALIPVVANKQFQVVGVDASTGLDAFRKIYDPIAPGDPLSSVVLPSPIDNDLGPYPVYASPARIEVIDMAVEGIPIDSVGNLEMMIESGSLKVRNTSAVPRRVTVMNTATTSLSELTLAPDIDTNAGPATAGDRVLVAFREENIDADQPITITFSRPLFLGASGETDAVDAYIHALGLLKLKTGAAPGSLSDITEQVKFVADSGNRRLRLELSGALQRGKLFALVVSRDLAAEESGAAGLKLLQRKVSGDTGPLLPSDLVLYFRTREPGGPLAETTLASGTVRDLTLNGNVALVSALDGGLQAFDIADPASLDGAVPAGRVAGGATEFWAIASDRHGRIYTTGLTSMFGVLRSYRLEDFLPETPGTTKEVPNDALVSGAMLSWRLGYASPLPLGSEATLSDRPEGLPRKLQVVLQDNELPLTLDGLTTEFLSFNVPVAAEPSIPYEIQRVTIENRTASLRWSVDVPRGGSKTIEGVLARKGDDLTLVRNETTYGVVSLFGYGIGVFDLNAIESNDNPVNPATYKPVAEKVAMTDAKPCSSDPLVPCASAWYEPVCTPDPNGVPCPLRDLSFTPDALIHTLPGSAALAVYALEANRGVLDVFVMPPRENPAPPPAVLPGEAKPATGLALSAPPGSPHAYHPRLRTLRSEFVAASGREPRARFTGVSPYVTRDEDGRELNYALIAARDFGVVVVKFGGAPLTFSNLVDVIWIPAGAYSVRVMPGSDMAVVIDGAGRVLLVDLTRIDESEKVAAVPPCGATCPPADLFPTALGSISAEAAPLPDGAWWTEVGADDTRIIWKSEPGLVKGTLAPLVDPETGIVFTGDVTQKTLRVVAATDPRVRVVVDAGSPGGYSETGRIVPLGVAPPANAPLIGENASLAAFRVEVRLPGAIDEALGGTLSIEVESERIADAKTEDTLPGWPHAHLGLTLRRAVPSDIPKLRYQRGYNNWVSPWIVGIADPRASESWVWPAGTTAGQKAAQGCAQCERPQLLKGRPEPDVFELTTAGRLLAIRPDVTLFSGTKYAYLAQQNRLDARVSAVPADTIRPREVQIAAQNPPVAEGALEETIYLHSGEVETSMIDLDAGGRAGLNVVADRTYLSRTLGGTAFGAGWDSMLLRRLRELPNGSVEYRDGSGEVWVFNKGLTGYEAPGGVFLRLNKTDNGWMLLDQQWRQTRFDALGRISGETDHFYDGLGGGNLTRYLYDSFGRLARVIDPVGRETLIRYNTAGLVQEISDWRGRKAGYTYDAGRLMQVALPEAKAAEGVPGELDHSGANRPRLVYSYDTIGGPNDTIELRTNLKSIKDPAEVASGGTARVIFNYAADRVTGQKWASGETATFTYGAATTTVMDALGQKRVYELTDASTHDKRAHVAGVTAEEVPILHFGTTLPASASPTMAPEAQPLSRSMTYTDDGQILKIAYPNLLVVASTYDDAANGAPGKVLTKTTESGPLFAGSETRYTRTPSTNLVEKIGRTEAGELSERDTPQPSRSSTRTVVTDDGVSIVSSYNAAGQLTSVKQTAEGSETAVISAFTAYYTENDGPISRGRPSLATRGGGEIEQKFAYQLTADGGERIEIRDAVRGTATETVFDSFGRKVREIARESDGTVLGDERFGYDANGRLVYHARTQTGMGLVETRVKYDAMGREAETSTTGAAVGGAPATIKTTMSYDLANRKITRTDPTSGASVPAEEVTTYDGLGRALVVERRGPTVQTIVQKYAYDASGELSFESDGARVATIYQHDLFGRTTAIVGSDGRKTETRYKPWGEAELITARDGAGEISGQTRNFFTPRGRLRSTNEAIGTVARKTHVARLEGGRATVVRVGEVPNIETVDLASGLHRAQQIVRDAAGRVVDERLREVGPVFDLDSTSGVWSMRKVTFAGGVPSEVQTSEPKVAATYRTTLRYDGLSRAVEQIEAGTYTTRTTYDEASNPTAVMRPGMDPETASYDSRGLVTKRTLADGKTNEYRYDELGNLRQRIDEGGESTFYDYDPLGRLTKTRYADDTFEETTYENLTGAIKATRDRASQWLSHSYDSAGRVTGIYGGEDPATAPLLVKYEYDAAGRLKLVRNKDAGIDYAEYDQLGRPGLTRTYRYLSGTGLESSSAKLDVHTQRHQWSVFDSERASWRMPAAGEALPIADNPLSKWLQTIVETRDAGSNLVAQVKDTGGDLTSGDARAAGRLSTRRRHLTSGGAMTTAYGFADGNPLPGSVELPPLVVGATVPASGLPLWSETSIGSQRLAGSANRRDEARRLDGLRDLGTQRLSAWDYDARGRLTDTWPSLTSTLTEAPISDMLVDADFRAQRTANPFLTASQHATLGSEATKIEPLTWTATRAATHQLDDRTLMLDGVVQSTRNYAFSGSRRTSDGVWTLTYDGLGRVTSATSADRRVELTWDPNDRLVGRAAYEPDGSGGWKVETRNSVITRDGLPAETTFVWDPIVDRLVAIFEQGASTESGAAADAGLRRQYLHGDQGYDDPTRVLAASPSGGDPETYFPIDDEAGVGSLLAVADESGNLVERALYADAYGDAPRYLQSAVADKITLEVTKDGAGNLANVRVRVHLSERVDDSTLATGARLASVKADKTLAQLTTVAAEMEGDHTIRWSLSPSEWNSLALAPEAAMLEVSLTSALRAEGWGETPVAEVPGWARILYSGAAATPSQPVIYRESLTSISSFMGTIGSDNPASETLYEIKSLYLAASEESKAKLLTGFHAAPFVEPASGLVLFRDRWYDPSTGNWLTPDAEGYAAGSSNLYAGFLNDPVNHRDPTGNEPITAAAVLTYLGWTAVNTGIDVGVDYAFNEVGDWWNGTETEFDWHDSLQTNFAVNLVTGGIGGKLKNAKRAVGLFRNTVMRKAVSEGIEFGADVAVTGTVDMALHDVSAGEAYGSAFIGGLTGRTISHGGAKFRDMFVGARRALRPNTPWNLGDSPRGEVIEQMLGHNLPGSFPTIDRFDPFSGHATSIKSIDLTLKTPSNPRTFDRLLRGYVDKVAEFPTRTIRRKRVVIGPEDVSMRGLDIAIEQGAATWTQSLALRRARRYGQQHGVDVRIFGID